MQQMRQNLVAQFVQLLKRWLYDLLLGVVEKNWAFSVDQCWLQALQFVVLLIDLLSILLKCNGFAGIQEAVVNQTSMRSPNSEHGPLFGASLASVSALELIPGPPTELVIAGCCVKSTLCSMSQSGQKMVHCCIE
ncbi:unnamed protein product [Rangifer tarandus platyrhynchus]|uniref:Uncharacterized protein n=1 Tax=Rangifer tarandus platyrhynchus TaxID=3082113 RepID=A0ABN8YTP1_RANTA|nr:unnamed protein product [Rangifer tarandus platyrhynchus]